MKLPIISTMLYASLPAALIVVTGVWIRAKGSDQVRQRWTIFLLLALLFLLTGQVLVGVGNNPPLELLFIPTLIGVLAALMIHHLERLRATSQSVSLVFLGLYAFILIISITSQTMNYYLLMIGVNAFVISMVWQAISWPGVGRWLAYLPLLLGALALSGFDLQPWIDYSQAPASARSLYGSIIFSLHSFAVTGNITLAGMLVVSGLEAVPRWRLALSRFALAIIAVLIPVYLILAAILWDNAEDGLSAVGIFVTGFFTSIACGLLLGWRLRRWGPLLGVVFPMAITMLLSASISAGMRIDNIAVTEARATQINRAIQRYYQSHENYPPALSHLVPGYLLRIREPVIIRGHGWCYEGGPDYYRLGYVFRPIFSAPASTYRINLYAVGEPPHPHWPCEAELERAKAGADPGAP